jgi:hypothetical protein
MGGLTAPYFFVQKELFMSFARITKNVLTTLNTVFGDDVTYNYSSGISPASTLKGVFDNAFIEIQGVTTLKPVLKVLLSDLSEEPVENDYLTIDSIVYTVLDSQPDSYGATLLILEKT